MTTQIVPPTVFNPTVFLVTDTNDKRIPPEQGLFIKSLIEQFGYVYGSYYRPGEFWNEHVFCCPHCAHATLLDENENLDEFYCKYCYTDWKVINGRMMMNHIQYDDDGEELKSEWV